MSSKASIFIFGFLFLVGCSNLQPAKPTLASPPDLSVATVQSTEDLTLSDKNLNTTSPNDVIQEIAYFGAFGGYSSGCYEPYYPVPAFASDYSNLSDPVEIFSSVETDICGLADNEIVNIEINLPNGSVQNYQSVAKKTEWNNQPEINFEYIPNLHGPTGRCVLIFSGNKWSFQRNVNVVDADSARLYLVDSTQLALYKFRPNEKIRLFVYQEIPGTDYLKGFSGRRTQKLVGWKQYKVDEDGELTLDVQIEGKSRFIAVGEYSGAVIYRPPNFDSEYYSWAVLSMSDFYCQGAPSLVGLKPNSYAKVVTEKLPLFESEQQGEGASQRIVLGKVNKILPKGSILKIDSNPSCIEESWWWQVSCTDTRCSGYVQEANSEGVHLEPLQEASVSPSNENSNSLTCPGAPKTRVEVGIKARVTYTNGTPVRLRKKPGTSGKVIDKLPEGTQFQIFDGPQCLEGFVWWKIEVVSNGLDGWVAEGDMDSYYIEPIQ